MRIISGERKGRRLLGPDKKSKTRPTKDQVKEAVFDILGPIKKDSYALDLFAGTGQIGIEFLSRGCGFAYFCEQSPYMVNCIIENLNKAKYTDKALVLKGDFRRRLNHIDKKVDYIYLDPPYYQDMVKEAMEKLITKNVMNEGATIVVETAEDESFEYTETYELLTMREYKFNKIYIFKFNYKEKEEQ